MKKTVVINDLSGLGKCSLTAAIPVISCMGVQAVPFPTAILSNQTGYESYYFDDYSRHMDDIMQEWKKRQFIPDGIYTGFLAGAVQAEKILKFLELFGSDDCCTQILVDPVMGDNGKAYPIYSDELCGCMKKLAECATIITPNLTEAFLLMYGLEGEKKYDEMYQTEVWEEHVEKLAHDLSVRFNVENVVITGINVKGKNRIANFVLSHNEEKWFVADKIGGSYSGTGDILASIIIAGKLKGKDLFECVELAMKFISEGIKEAFSEGTNRNEGIAFENYLGMLTENK